MKVKNIKKPSRVATIEDLQTALAEFAEQVSKNLNNLSSIELLSIRAHEIVYKVLVSKGIVTEEELAKIAEEVDKEIEVQSKEMSSTEGKCEGSTTL